MKNLIIQKYGGATVSDPEKIKAIAQRISLLTKEGKKLVVVVSAMGKTTNQLIELAKQVSKNPARREMDMLLSTGERIAMSLLSIALNDLGCSAISFTGSQAGILTDESHVNAYIKEINAPRVKEALAQNKVVVLAGFQGVSPLTKEITTLGRGGSDITAIAMASYLGADRCEILKDVESVFTADPQLIKGVRPIHQLSYAQLLEMTFWGAKFLHYRSVELANQFSVPLFISSAAEPKSKGTNIYKQGNTMQESSKILSINSHEQVLELICQNFTMTDALVALENFLTSSEIPFPQILQIIEQDKRVKILLTGPNESLQAIDASLKDKKDFSLSEKLSAVAAHCTGATSANTVKLVTQALQKAKIKPLQILTSPMSVIAIVPQAARASTIQSLHQLID